MKVNEIEMVLCQREASGVVLERDNFSALFYCKFFPTLTVLYVYMVFSICSNIFKVSSIIVK